MSDAGPPPLTTKNRRKSLIAAIAAISVVAMTMGLTIPLMSLVMEARGTSATMIGLNTTVQYVGILLASPFVPALLGRLKLMPCIWIGMGGCVLTIATMPVFDSLASWFVLRFALGCAEGLIFVAGETWVNQIVEDRYRGRIVGVYGTVLGAGYAVGPALIEVTGITGAMPFMVGAGLVALSALPLTLVVRHAPLFDGAVSHSMWRFAVVVPVVIGAGFMFGLIDAGAMGLIPVYGRDIGLAAAAAARLLTVFILGGLVTQLPLGWLAERVDPSKLLVTLGVIVAVGLGLIPVFYDRFAMLYVLLFASGSAVGGLWTVGLIALGNRYRNTDLAAAVAVSAIAYGVGSAVGPMIAGTAMSIWKPHGLMLGIAAATALYVILSLAHLVRRKADRRA